MANVQATNAPRALYNELQNTYNKAKYPNVLITDSFLRLESNVSNVINTISFNMLTNQGGAGGNGAPTVTENRLQITDRFVAASLSIMIMKVNIAGAAGTAPTAAEQAIGRPRTYNNARIFTKANEATAFQAIYNSQLRITVDSTVYIQSLDVQRFYRAPTSEDGTAVSAVATTGVLNADGWDNANYPFAALTPTITFSGIGKNEVVISLPAAIDLTGTASTNFAIAWFRGYLVQNVNQGK